MLPTGSSYKFDILSCSLSILQNKTLDDYNIIIEIHKLRFDYDRVGLFTISLVTVADANIKTRRRENFLWIIAYFDWNCHVSI